MYVIYAIVFGVIYWLFARYNPTVGGASYPSPPTEYRPRSKYFSDWKHAADKRGIPYSVMDAAIFVESRDNLDTNGKAGEVGAFQILPATQKSLLAKYPELIPLNIYSVAGNAEYSAALFQSLYRKFSNWPQAIVAYNAGENNSRVKNPLSDWYYLRYINHWR